MTQSVQLASISTAAKSVVEDNHELGALVDSVVDGVDEHWNQQREMSRRQLKTELKNSAEPVPCTCSKILTVSLAAIVVLGITLCQLPCQLSKCCKRHAR